MKRLYAVEISRFLSRRSVRFFGMFLLLIVITAGSLTFVFSNRDFDAANAKARAAASADYNRCLQASGANFADQPKCEPPDLSQITADPRFDLTKLRQIFEGASVALIMLGFGLGASGVGAEWHHRTMTTLLTWEPRRVRVAVAKLAAGATVVFGAVIAFEALLGAALVPAAAFRGTTAGTTASWLAGVIGVGMRGAAIGAMGAVIGGALAIVTRNTAVALGISFAWLAVIENMIRGLRPRWGPWLIGSNAESFLGPLAGDSTRTVIGGGVVLAAYVLALALVAVRWFGRQDVA